MKVQFYDLFSYWILIWFILNRIGVGGPSPKLAFHIDIFVNTLQLGWLWLWGRPLRYILLTTLVTKLIPLFFLQYERDDFQSSIGMLSYLGVAYLWFMYGRAGYSGWGMIRLIYRIYSNAGRGELQLTQLLRRITG